MLPTMRASPSKSARTWLMASASFNCDRSKVIGRSQNHAQSVLKRDRLPHTDGAANVNGHPTDRGNP